MLKSKVLIIGFTVGNSINSHIINSLNLLDN